MDVPIAAVENARRGSIYRFLKKKSSGDDLMLMIEPYEKLYTILY